MLLRSSHEVYKVCHIKRFVSQARGDLIANEVKSVKPEPGSVLGELHVLVTRQEAPEVYALQVGCWVPPAGDCSVHDVTRPLFNSVLATSSFSFCTLYTRQQEEKTVALQGSEEMFLSSDLNKIPSIKQHAKHYKFKNLCLLQGGEEISLGPFDGAGLDLRTPGLLAIYRCACGGLQICSV